MGPTEQCRSGLEWVGADYEAIVRAASPVELDAPSAGTKWTNRELLFHMWFGQHVARILVPLMGGFSHVSPAASRHLAGALTAATGPYEWVNYAGSVWGVRLAGLDRARRWMAKDTEWLVLWLDRATEGELRKGMSVPPSWDPYFVSWMSREDLLRWAPQHYGHHRRQLSLGGIPRGPVAGAPAVR